MQDDYRELCEQLDDADRNSQQRVLGSRIFGDAKAAIEALVAERDKLRAALTPFATKANQAMIGYTDRWSQRMGPDYPVFGWNGPVFVLGDFLNAMEALKEPTP